MRNIVDDVCYRVWHSGLNKTIKLAWYWITGSVIGYIYANPLPLQIIKERDAARKERNDAREKCASILNDYDGRRQVWQNQLNVVKIRLEHYAKRHDKVCTNSNFHISLVVVPNLSSHSPVPSSYFTSDSSYLRKTNLSR